MHFWRKKYFQTLKEGATLQAPHCLLLDRQDRKAYVSQRDQTMILFAAGSVGSQVRISNCSNLTLVNNLHRNRVLIRFRGQIESGRRAISSSVFLSH
jgi:hypothetical protein